MKKGQRVDYMSWVEKVVFALLFATLVLATLTSFGVIDL